MNSVKILVGRIVVFFLILINILERKVNLKQRKKERMKYGKHYFLLCLHADTRAQILKEEKKSRRNKSKNNLI